MKFRRPRETGDSKKLLENASIEKLDLSRISVQTIAEIRHPRYDSYFTVRDADWKRLERKIRDLPNIPGNLVVWYSLFFGSGLAALIGIPPVLYAKDLSPWVIPGEIFLCAGSFVIGFGLKAVEKIFIKERKFAADELLADMADVVVPMQPKEQQSE